MTDEFVFVDTWGWVALGNARDAHHKQVTDLLRTLRRNQVTIVTSDFVLDELITLLFRRETYERSIRFVDSMLAAVNSGEMQLERVTPERFTAAWELRKRFQDKRMISFTDLTSMVIMSDRRITQVLTDDDHFQHVGLGFEKLV